MNFDLLAETLNNFARKPASLPTALLEAMRDMCPTDENDPLTLTCNRKCVTLTAATRRKLDAELNSREARQ